VEYAQPAGKPLGELTLEEYRRFSPEFQEDILELDITASMAAWDVATAPAQVARRWRKRGSG
jgi:hypothetical protein